MVAVKAANNLTELGILILKDGKYTVDITDYAKMIETAGFSYGTIVLVAERQNDATFSLRRFYCTLELF